MKIFIIACLIMSLFACGSKPPPETQYFVLTPNTVSSTSDEATFDKVLVIEPIKLAKFLDQPGIVMQTDSHKISVAHYHRWGEPIKKNMRRFITDTLKGSLSYPVMHETIGLGNDVNVLSLTISINQFNGVADGAAVLSGEWILLDENSGSVKTRESFHHKAALTQDGYTELVNQLATLLDRLCKDISDSIR